MSLGRRDFITLLGGAAVAWPFAPRAQQGERVRRLGVLAGQNDDDPATRAGLAALREGLAKLGWIEGRNLRIDLRFTGFSRLPRRSVWKCQRSSSRLPMM
jgi:putative tryptophan/tyrosine transport system substrate-binding protein